MQRAFGLFAPPDCGELSGLRRHRTSPTSPGRAARVVQAGRACARARMQGQTLILICTGEGAHCTETDVRSLQMSPSWPAADAAVRQSLGYDLHAFLAAHLGEHAAPASPLVTTIINILNVDRWRAAGHVPTLVLGHSIGEVAAAYAAGLLSLAEAISTARALGAAGAACSGAMVHTRLTRSELQAWPDSEPLRIATINGVTAGESAGPRSADVLSVTLCGPTAAVDAWLIAHPLDTRLKLPHAWHHPMYSDSPAVHQALGRLLPTARDASSSAGAVFISATRTQPWTRLDAAYWHEWLTRTIDFGGALEIAAEIAGSVRCYVIEAGAHPVHTPVVVQTLTLCGLRVIGTAASMRRGQPEGFWEAECKAVEAVFHTRPGCMRVEAPETPQLSEARAPAVEAPETIRLSDACAPAARVHAAAAPSPPQANVLATTLVELRRLLRDACSLDEALDADAPLLSALQSAGLHSEELAGLSETLYRHFRVRVPPTLILECGTMRTLAVTLASRILDERRHLGTQADGATSMTRAVVEAPPPPLPAPAGASRIEVRASSSRWPGAPGMGHLSTIQNAAGDCIVQVPSIRWDARDVPATACHGGFLAGAELFGHRAHGISLAEASAMDPQQRLLLDAGYEALLGASVRRSDVRGRNVGIAIGIMSVDFAALARRESGYFSTGTQAAFASGRLAFALDLHGPCVTVDTACSSSLVALRSGVQDLRDASCSLALVGAASLMLLPATSISFASARMLSDDGRCKTFDARANGYVRSEGVSIAVLARADCELARADCELIVADCAVRSDGRSASLTAPNGSAQTQLLHAVLAAENCAERIRAVETHGTGTALGDPIEIASLQRAVRAADPILSGAKANCGHTEPVAGLLGLCALARLLGQRTVACNAQLRIANRLLAPLLRSMGARVSTQGGPLVVGMVQLAGLSSFGYSGTIAHAIVAAPLHVGTRVGWTASLVLRPKARFPWRENASRTPPLRIYASCMVPLPEPATVLLERALVLQCAGPGLSSRPAKLLGTDGPIHGLWKVVAAICSKAPSTAPARQSIVLALALVQQLAASRPPAQLLVLSSGAPQGVVVGLARVVRLEHAAMQTICVRATCAARVMGMGDLRMAAGREQEMAFASYTWPGYG